MPGPVAIRSGVGDSRDHGQFVLFERTVRYRRNGRTLTLRIGVLIECFLEEWRQVGQLVRRSEILLGDLQLQHQTRLRHRPEQRAKGLTRHEIEWAVLDLHQHVVGKLSVQGHELVVGLLHPIGIVLKIVDKRPPHHDAIAPVLRQRRRQHIGPLRVIAAIFVRSRLPLGVGLHHKAAEVWHVVINFIDLGVPPGSDLRIQRIGGREPTNLDRSTESRGEVKTHPPRPQLIRQRGDFDQVVRRQHQRVGVHAGDDRPVDAQRCQRSPVVIIAGAPNLGQIRPLPQREPGVTALHEPVQVIPVIEDPPGDFWRR